ncbi:hypothetical protein Mpt1_c04850 [Candidatus Methanoplasma termitum]|uniref:Bacterial Pleckstrin homology domain-containing protein n=1 Tax=Candidatus Methanoplasma termitum TaxID=1577791 RepID=A0A0A7LDH4_9ARCH|nr:PH domain-containing protein [Candidatus Methanoplasma termitum]AIZ56377.1 hypothetical protein Mpt1_c04850 [Candidatus Methanoplasma termitum]
MKITGRANISWLLVAAIIVLAIVILMIAVLGYENIGMYILLTAAVLVLTFLLLAIVLKDRKTASELGYDGLTVRGAMLSVKIPYSDITSVEIRDEINFGLRVGGYAGMKRLGGKFRNSEFGVYDLSAIVSVKKYIVVRSNNRRVLVFNLETEAETVSFYERLSKWTGRGPKTTDN